LACLSEKERGGGAKRRLPGISFFFAEEGKREKVSFINTLFEKEKKGGVQSLYPAGNPT